jgi:hypothetical protein
MINAAGACERECKRIQNSVKIEGGLRVLYHFNQTGTTPYVILHETREQPVLSSRESR